MIVALHNTTYFVRPFSSEPTWSASPKNFKSFKKYCNNMLSAVRSSLSTAILKETARGFSQLSAKVRHSLIFQQILCIVVFHQKKVFLNDFILSFVLSNNSNVKWKYAEFVEEYSWNMQLGMPKIILKSRNSWICYRIWLKSVLLQM